MPDKGPDLTRFSCKACSFHARYHYTPITHKCIRHSVNWTLDILLRFVSVTRVDVSMWRRGLPTAPAEVAPAEISTAPVATTPVPTAPVVAVARATFAGAFAGHGRGVAHVHVVVIQGLEDQ